MDDPWRIYDEMETRLTASVSERMLDLADVVEGINVLDLACGRGEPALRAARRVAPRGRVLGIDISDKVLHIARERAAREGITNVELREATAEALVDLAPATFDVVTCRWGLMYMQSPIDAMRGARRVLRTDGKLVIAVWAGSEDVSWATVPRRALARVSPESVPPVNPSSAGPFRYGDSAALARDLAAAELTITHSETAAVAVVEARDGAGIISWARDLRLLPILETLPASVQQAWERVVSRDLEHHRENDGMIRLGGITRLVVAQFTSS